MNIVKKICRLGLLIISIGFLQTGCSSSYVSSSTSEDNQSGYNLADLNSYGDWVQIDGYGRAWYPYAVQGWMPFENGHWSWLNGDWTWVSYEPFGWIVYHYGYWYDDPFYGWVWIPSDSPWIPANVLWINYDDYIGWAPLPPRDVTYKNPWEESGSSHWQVVRREDFAKDNVVKYRLNPPIRNEIGLRGENERTPPSKTAIEQSIGKTIPESRMNQEIIKLPPRQIQKMNLPEQENKRVEQNSPRVRNEVLVPKNVYQKKQRDQNERRK
jgi:hypothetical protein